ncbi:hypothetical protein T440DRAFT_439486 [Plenodomus tracheiphilus IPT5]|uniref:DNA-directed RNA polymerase subunit n=1 Tax=Plenodomus tracheiphilus IPT5 TaxID=1408161 RepID=A0A6A7BLW2_9PLEO|nr:hypothetical protein T440DRAFT_439486 [Plenodomus tracheiphilus IPT5]
MAPIQAESSSLLHQERIAQYVSLSPACLATPLPAVCASIFSPLLLSYFPPARGIVLAYTDVELHDSPDTEDEDDDSKKNKGQELLLRHIDEYSSPFLWASATFLVFRPKRNTSLTGTLTHQSRTHISLSYLNTFPVSVLAAHLPSTWSWHAETANRMKKGWDGRISDEGGWWVIEGEGMVKNGRGLEVRIRDFEGRMDGKGRGKGFLRIEGSLLSVEEEAAKVQKGKGRA